MAGEAGFLDVSIDDYEISILSPSFPPALKPDEEKPEDEPELNLDEDDDKNSKLPLPGKKHQKGPKVIINTKSEEDKPDDGYRWRMYGRKAVKGSEFWRNYYRCTTPDCGVRRMTERSVSDPETVVTTYVGVHTHAVPVKDSTVNHHYTGGGSGGSGGALSSGFSDIPARIQGFTASGSGFDPTPSSTSGGTGLLEDMLPSHLRRNIN